MIIDIDDIRAAWWLAATWHKGQQYASHQPNEHVEYLEHLGAVALEVQNALLHHPNADRRLALLCAILHDILEDTACPPATIRQQFGQPVLEGVLALTKNENLPDKATKMADSLRRIQACPPEVAIVKIADRICNLAPPPFHWTSEKIAAYKAEARTILDALGHNSAYLAERLQKKIAAYGK